MAEAASTTAPRRWTQRTIAPWLFLAPGLFMFGVYVLWPIIQSVTLSFYDWNGLYNQDGDFTGRFVGMGNYLWHPAAISTLSERYPDKRGFAIAILLN